MIAPVIGTTVRGYIVLGDAIHLLLDNGFIWKIYSDAEMGLLPHPVAVAELEVNDELLDKIKTDIEVLLRDDLDEALVIGLSPLTFRCVISEVLVFTSGDLRKVLLMGEAGSIEIQTSVTSETVRISECEAK